jgi:glucose-6-phosphate dehydrogenase assembly protein OpcA
MPAATAPVGEWTGEDVSVAEIDRQLALLRQESAAEGDAPYLRASVMTHIAWVPEEWRTAANEVMQGLAERHPSRTLVLHPDPRGPDRLDVTVLLQCFPLQGGVQQHVCTEVIELRLGGTRAKVPASIVVPLLLSDLPVFLRWRGQPPFGKPDFEELVGVTDRLIVDSHEWRSVPRAWEKLAAELDRAAVSDIAWARTLGWRRSLAALWPSIRRLSMLEVHGPKPEALLLRGWLVSRLRHDVKLKHRPAETVELVRADGEEVQAPRGAPATPADLLSGELDRYGRDPVYEEALAAAA